MVECVKIKRIVKSLFFIKISFSLTSFYQFNLLLKLTIKLDLIGEEFLKNKCKLN